MDYKDREDREDVDIVSKKPEMGFRGEYPGFKEEPEDVQYTARRRSDRAGDKKRNDDGDKSIGKAKRRKQNRNLFLFGVVIGVLLSTTTHLLVPGILKKEDKIVEAPAEPIETPVETPVVELPPEPVPEELMEGRNHANKAEEYAHSIEEVKRVMAEGRDDEKKMMYLTFDDGPGSYTEEILNVLAEKEVPATFFLLGTQVEKTSKTNTVWERYIKEGHGIAIHTYSHDYNLLYPNRTPDVEKIKEEWNTTITLLRERLGEDFNTRVLRFPGGSMSWKNMPETKELLKAEEIYDIDWNAITGDSDAVSKRPKSAEEVYEKIKDGLSRAANNETAVLLMHDTKEDSAKYLGYVIDKLKEEGFEFGILY